MAFTNFETLFLEVSVTIWHLSTWERVRKKKKREYNFEKNNGTSLVRAVTTMLPSKIVNDLTEIIIKAHRQLVNVRRFTIVQ